MTKSKTTPAMEGFTVVRIDYERMAKLKRLAREEDRSIAAVLRRILDSEFEREGVAA